MFHFTEHEKSCSNYHSCFMNLCIFFYSLPYTAVSCITFEFMLTFGIHSCLLREHIFPPLFYQSLDHLVQRTEITKVPTSSRTVFKGHSFSVSQKK